jgi:hypothetical protein
MDPEAIAQAVTEMGIDKVITCPQAFAIAKKYGIAIGDIGEYCNNKGIKIRGCQLGCFK